MKKLFFLILLFCSFISFSQSKADMKSEIESLKKQVETLTNDVKVQKSENEQFKSLMIAKLNDVTNSVQSFHSLSIAVLPSDTVTKNLSSEKKQCKAITQAGTQCKRMAESGSDYCWQHKSSEEIKSTVKTTSSSSGSNRTIQTGSRGGQYYINKNGNKTYVKRK